MNKLNNFIKKSIIGGLLVISPIVILFFAFRWAFYTLTNLIQPLVTPIAQHSSAPEFVIDLFVISMILLGCFLVGSIVSTSAGHWLHSRFDNSLAKMAPGYNLVRDIIQQFFGEKSESPFKTGTIARVQLFGCDIATDATAIVTSRHHNGWFTVFIPTGPNPTSGFIYHLPPEQVKLYPEIKVDEALRTIISCGVGSNTLFNTDDKVTKS
jgi:uncharacterized membrane protein